MKQGTEKKAYNVYLNGTLQYTTFATINKKTRTQREKKMRNFLIQNDGCDHRISVSEFENNSSLHT